MKFVAFDLGQDAVLLVEALDFGLVVGHVVMAQGAGGVAAAIEIGPFVARKGGGIFVRAVEFGSARCEASAGI